MPKPVRQASRDAAPPRPALPEGEEPQIARAVVREIARALGKGPRADDVALALSVGSAAIDEGRTDVALEALRWAKSQAPRIAAIREALGVAWYLDESFDEALRELQAYRRMTDRNDQNHLIADCERALGKSLDQIAATASALVSDERAPLDRRAEAAIVWAGAMADDGDVPGGRAVLRRFLRGQRLEEVETRVRVHYVVADLAERAGDVATASEAFGEVVRLSADYLDAADRLRMLGAS